MHIGSHCRQLVQLDLGFCDNLNAEMMGRIFEGCPLLETLNLEGCQHVDHDCIRCICVNKFIERYEINRTHNYAVLYRNYGQKFPSYKIRFF